MESKESKEKQQHLISYKAKEVSTDEVIAEGDDLAKVNKIAKQTGKNYKIVYVPNPNLSFVF